MPKVIEHIAYSKIVIADLSEKKPNVLYELGLSRVFHKDSTIVICNQNKTPLADIPADIVGTNIIFYDTTDTTVFGTARKKLTATIKALHTGDINPSPNHVYQFTNIPGDHLMEVLTTKTTHSSGQSDQQLAILQSTITDFETIPSSVLQYRDKDKPVQEIRPQSDPTDEEDFWQLFLEYSKNDSSQYSGSKLVDTLREHAKKNDSKAFKEFYFKAVTSNTPTADDIRHVLRIFDDGFNNPDAERTVLVGALLLYPSELDFETRYRKVTALFPKTRNRRSALEDKDTIQNDLVQTDGGKFSPNKI